MQAMFRLWRTVRHMRWRQIAYRLYYKGVAPRVRPLGALPLRSWHSAAQWPAWQAQSVWPDGICQFLNQMHAIRVEQDWNTPDRSKLWLYNLHYLDELSAVHAVDRRRMHALWWQRWLAENPVGHGNGWEPYPLSLRIVNLVKWWSCEKVASNEAWIASFVLQVQWLAARKEYHLLGNHLLANAKALVFAGAFLDGAQAAAWLADGLSILDEQLAEQFLDDGGHFELSPMYHATMMWDVCDLLRLAALIPLPVLVERQAAWAAVIRRGLRWMHMMTHPDGRIAFFNDAAWGGAPSLPDLQLYAEQLQLEENEGPEAQALRLRHCSASGYVRMDAGPRTVVIADVARIGPDYLPGHAHADTLSFEFSLHGQRVLVNSGTSEYGEGPERNRQRGTAAHNTVQLAGVDSSEVWGGFRVGRRAYPRNISMNSSADALHLQAEHSGYLWLGGLHKRSWRLEHAALTVEDSVRGGSATAYFHFHPDIRLENAAARSMNLYVRDQKIATLECSAGHLHLEPGTWHPAFGQVVPNLCLRVVFEGDRLQTRIHW
jgi:uncharacterized heparinase superfamily protein